EIERGEPPLVAGAPEQAPLLLFPGEAPHDHRKALFPLGEGHFADLCNRVLHMGGNHTQILFVEGGQLQKVHCSLTTLARRPSRPRATAIRIRSATAMSRT